MKRVFSFIGVMLGYAVGLVLLVWVFSGYAGDDELVKKIPYSYSLVFAVALYVMSGKHSSTS